ncbi:MAG: MTAP family purine nucleoside phosphorylase [Deltaproteobacteria bacterium]
MKRTGIVSGTLFSNASVFGEMIDQKIENKYGEVIAYASNDIVFLPRHKSANKKYTLPHQINHLANMLALKELGVTQVIGVASTGSLKKHITPSSILVPNDFISLYQLPTTIENEAKHMVPKFDSVVREGLIEAIIRTKQSFFDGGVYWQVPGPRLETKAEITMMASFADVVGMTIASEASVCLELELPYAAICSVDNYANGIGDELLSMENIVKNSSANANAVIEIIKFYTDQCDD